MKSNKRIGSLFCLGTLASLAGAGCIQEPNFGDLEQAIVAGAGYTTFDATVQGCLDSPNGVNCNNYENKQSVYMSGGPRTGAGLSDGTYYFSVLVPGYQNGGFVEGADGNLSDTTTGATVNDNGTGDDISNRTFTVQNEVIVSYTGTHLMGTSPNGKPIIALFPYDTTSNNGGVYILAICQVGATNPSGCKYDAFRLQTEEECTDPNGCGTVVEFGVVSGMKYYDANTNGQFDAGTEEGIPNWLIDYRDGVSEQVYTDANGEFSLSLIEDEYVFTEAQGGSSWMQTGNTVDQTSSTGGSSATLNADMTYTVNAVDGSLTAGIYFGNVCVGAAQGSGGHTMGYWSNKNGQAVMKGTNNFSTSLSLLQLRNLRTASGANFDPASYSAYRTWLLNARATNMAYMLSAQLSAMEMNVLWGYVSPTALIYAPGATTANAAGFTTVSALMNEANTSLAHHGYTVAESATRTYQEALKNALDRGNNNVNFVRPTWRDCPVPTLWF